MGNVFRFVRLLRVEGRDGVKRRSVRIAGRWIRRIRGRRPLRDLLRELRRAERPTIVVASTVDWNIVLFQRPQQLARAWSALGHVCLFVTPNEVDEVAGHERIGADLYLVDRLEICLRALDRIVLVVPSPTPDGLDMRAVRRARTRAGARVVVVYDYLDAIHPAITPVSARRLAAHEELLRTADLVSVTARSLLQEAQDLRGEAQDRRGTPRTAGSSSSDSATASGTTRTITEPTRNASPSTEASPSEAIAAHDAGIPASRCLLIPNAADVEHFRPTPSLGHGSEIPTDMKDIVASSDPIIGYAGALARWVDYELLREMAARRPSWRLVLVGWDFDGSLGESGLLALPNIHFLGPKPYETLPRYVAAFDAAILPFLVNEVTTATSPIKLFEYMAARKPIVATDLPECRGYASVAIAVGTGAFVASLERALTLKHDPAHLRQLDRDADANTWSQRAREILDAVADLPG